MQYDGGREIRWTDWSEEHIAAHGVSGGEVEDVVHRRPRLAAKGRDGTDLVYGRTAAGRYLLVVLSPDEVGPTSFVVTAREMNQSEKALYRHKAR